VAEFASDRIFLAGYYGISNGTLLCTILFAKLSLETGIDRPEICVLLGLGILSTALPFFCYTVAAQRLPIVLATSILLLEPMFAVLFASIALRESPSLWFGIGSILVFWGLRSIAKAANLS
jgi:drug/metabolite transporter (DMT)-like permease